MGLFGTAAVIVRAAASRTGQGIRQRAASDALRESIKTTMAAPPAKAAPLAGSRVPALSQAATVVAPGSSRIGGGILRASRVHQGNFKTVRAKVAAKRAAVANLGGRLAKQVVRHAAPGSSRTRVIQPSANHALLERSKTSRGRAVAKTAIAANLEVLPA